MMGPSPSRNQAAATVLTPARFPESVTNRHIEFEVRTFAFVVFTGLVLKKAKSSPEAAPNDEPAPHNVRFDIKQDDTWLAQGHIIDISWIGGLPVPEDYSVVVIGETGTKNKRKIGGLPSPIQDIKRAVVQNTANLTIGKLVLVPKSMLYKVLDDSVASTSTPK